MSPPLERQIPPAPVFASTGAVVTPVRGVADICTFVDDLDASAAGELSIERGGQCVGAVYVEGGRICWAAAKGFARRLTELLVAGTGDVLSMERHFRACQDSQVPLGEHLVGRGIVSADELRCALLQHSVESLVHLCESPARGVWRAQATARYNARFSFSSAEIAVRAHSLGPALGAESERAAAELDRFFGENEWGAAFVRTRTRATPEAIALRGQWPTSATALRRIGSWAASAIDLARAPEGDTPFLAITMPPSNARIPGRGAVLVAFGRSPLLFVGETGSHGPARILNRRAQLRRERG